MGRGSWHLNFVSAGMSLAQRTLAPTTVVTDTVENAHVNSTENITLAT